MNRTWTTFALGLVVGGAVAALLAVLVTGGGRQTARLEEEVASLREANGRLERNLAEARSAPADAGSRAGRGDEARIQANQGDTSFDKLEEAPPPVDEAAPIDAPTIVAGPVSDDDMRAAVREFGNDFVKLLTGTGDAATKIARDLAARDPTIVDRLITRYQGEEDMGVKTVLAHFLAQTGDPRALDALKAAVRDPDAGLIGQRTAAHGLAFSGDERLQPFLEEIARDQTVERGTRGNISFGLARRTDEGIELYARTVDEAFAASDPAAAQYLSGFALLGKRAAPVMEKRLLTLKETQARLVLIQLLSQSGRPESIASLRQVAADPEASEEVRQAAERAAAKLGTRD